MTRVDTAKLGEFLKACRQRTPPHQAGFADGGRRRTPGLRREEVAQLAGVSVTWYTWLEQGRAVRPSHAALERLSRGLRLSAAEEAYLFDLAGLERPLRAERSVPPALMQGIVDGCGGNPALILGRYWDFLAWNAAADDLLGGLSGLDGLQRNNLGFMLLHPEARRRTPDWEDRAQRLIAEFRADCSRYLGEAAFLDLVNRLEAASPLFAAVWREQTVLSREAQRKTYLHPRRGLLAFEQVSLLLMRQTDIKLLMYLPV
ncbi:MAG: helix-turn-helix transcriptional regulator [Rhodospirillaceae bacterium]